MQMLLALTDENPAVSTVSDIAVCADYNGWIQLPLFVLNGRLKSASRQIAFTTILECSPATNYEQLRSSVSISEVLWPASCRLRGPFARTHLEN